MDTKCQAVLEAALELSDDQRAWLAAEVLATLPGEDAEQPTDDDWVEELDRRWEESKADPAATIPWSELRTQT